MSWLEDSLETLVLKMSSDKYKTNYAYLDNIFMKLPLRFRNDFHTFNDFILDASQYWSSSTKKTYQDLKKLNNSSLLVTGPKGIGKTSMLYVDAIRRTIKQAEEQFPTYTVDFGSGPIEKWRDWIVSYGPNEIPENWPMVIHDSDVKEFAKTQLRDETNWLFEKYKEATFLGIDDLGKTIYTEKAIGSLYDIISYRYDYLLPTTVTSNFNKEQLISKYGENFDHILNRLTEMKATGESVRDKILIH